MAIATIASQQAITASPVAAATAAMIGLFAEKGMTQWGLPEILMICVPATLAGVIVAAIVSMFLGKDLADDPEYQAALKAGKIPPPKTYAAVAGSAAGVHAKFAAVASAAAGAAPAGPAMAAAGAAGYASRVISGADVAGGQGRSRVAQRASASGTLAGSSGGAGAGIVQASAPETPPLKPGAKISAYVFLVGVALVVLFGFFPSLRTLPGAKSAIAMPTVIEIVMMAVAAIMLVVTKVVVDEVPKTPTLRAGVVAVIGIFGLAWLGDSFIAANKDVIVPAIGDWAKAAPWTFAFGLFFASVLLYSQAATTRALMPLGMALGIPPQFLIGMFPSVNGYFFIPTYGSLIAAINFDLSGTTKIGKYVLNHSFMIPGIIATSVAVMTGLAIARLIF
jgi:anaerobic C4-dicarboxylate transporter